MTRTSAASIALALLCATVDPLGAQGPADDVTRAVLERDRAFWAAYNRCDVPAMSEYFTEDVEFYHDRGGVTLGRPALVKALQDGLCGDPGSRTRREPVEGAVKLYPMKKGDAVYGAILAGEHLFYLTQKGQPESLDGRARFADLWTVKDGVWRMSRVLSFDHGPAVR
jgi:ketosteroid isomerase-like protein